MIKEREEVCKLMCLPTVVGCCKREIKCELMSERGLRRAPWGGGQTSGSCGNGALTSAWLLMPLNNFIMSDTFRQVFKRFTLF